MFHLLELESARLSDATQGVRSSHYNFSLCRDCGRQGTLRFASRQTGYLFRFLPFKFLQYIFLQGLLVHMAFDHLIEIPFLSSNNL